MLLGDGDDDSGPGHAEFVGSEGREEGLLGSACPTNNALFRLSSDTEILLMRDTDLAYE